MLRDGTSADRSAGTPLRPGNAVVEPVAAPYSIRAYDPRDVDAILALLRLTIGETAATRKSADSWRWKHADNPFGPSYSVCAWDSSTGRIVGLRTLMWWSFGAAPGVTLRAVRAVDTATHPLHQRRGIFSALTRYAMDDLRDRGVPFIFNTPNASSLPGYLKLGWRVAARWPVYVRPVTWLRFGRSWIRGRAAGIGPGEPLPPPAAGLATWGAFRDRHDRDFALLLSAHETLRSRVGYRTERNLTYLDWRYGSHPDVEYGVHTYTDAAGLAGVVVARPVVGPRGLRALLITELLLRTPTPRAGARVLNHLRRACHADYLVAHFATGTIERRALARAGFLPAPGRGYTFVARPLNAAPLDPALPTSWDLSLGELELF